LEAKTDGLSWQLGLLLKVETRDQHKSHGVEPAVTVFVFVDQRWGEVWSPSCIRTRPVSPYNALTIGFIDTLLL